MPEFVVGARHPLRILMRGKNLLIAIVAVMVAAVVLMIWSDRYSTSSSSSESVRINRADPVIGSSEPPTSVAIDVEASKPDKGATLTSVPGEVTYTSVSSEYPRAFEMLMTLGPPAGSSLDALKAAQAELNAGKAHAGVKMYMAIRQCQELDVAAQMRELEQARGNPAVHEVLLARNEQTLRNCQGVGPLEIAQGYAGLRQAADLGDIPAQLLYVSGAELEFATASEMIRSPEKLIRFRNDSMRYLNQAAARGSVQAIQLLANAYESGVITTQDRVKSYLYRYADYLLAPGELTQQSVERASSHLSAEQVSAAQEQARKFLEKCCRGIG